LSLVLVRAVAPEFGGRVVGNADVPLGDHGRARARAAAELIRARGEVSRVHAPARGHAAEAAAVLAEALGGGVPVVSSEQLAELHLGLWQGLTDDELARRHKVAFRAFVDCARAVVPPEGEEVDAARARLGRELARITKRRRRDRRSVVVVAPELAFVLLVAAVEGREAPDELWQVRRAGDDVRFFEI
jgi:probable phosphoglycerate mutase